MNIKVGLEQIVRVGTIKYTAVIPGRSFVPWNVLSSPISVAQTEKVTVQFAKLAQIKT